MLGCAVSLASKLALVPTPRDAVEPSTTVRIQRTRRTTPWTESQVTTLSPTRWTLKAALRQGEGRGFESRRPI